MPEIQFTAADESDTAKLGQALAEVLPPGTVIGLVGTLGAGKTRLVQAVAEGLGVPRKNVTSPTFVLVNEHQGQKPIYHFDTYRLKDEDEFLELGPDEYFEGEGLTFVEWADRFEVCLPPERVTIKFTVTGETTRQIEISTQGETLDKVLNQLQSKL